jgi:hypothetical protein
MYQSAEARVSFDPKTGNIVDHWVPGGIELKTKNISGYPY